MATEESYDDSLREKKEQQLEQQLLKDARIGLPAAEQESESIGSNCEFVITLQVMKSQINIGTIL